MKSSTPNLLTARRLREDPQICDICQKLLSSFSSLYTHKRNRHSLLPMKNAKFKEIVQCLTESSNCKYNQERAIRVAPENLVKLTELYIKHKILYTFQVLSFQEDSHASFPSLREAIAKNHLFYSQDLLMRGLIDCFPPVSEECILADLTADKLIQLALDTEAEGNIASVLLQYSKTAVELLRYFGSSPKKELWTVLIEFSLELASLLNREKATLKIALVLVTFGTYLSEGGCSEPLNNLFVPLFCEEFKGNFLSFDVRQLLMQDLIVHFVFKFVPTIEFIVSFEVARDIMILFQRWLEIKVLSSFKLVIDRE